MARKNETPYFATFYRLFRVLDPRLFEVFFRRWVSQIVHMVVQPGQLAIDGKTKTILSSDDGVKRPVHLISTFSTELGVLFGQ